MWLPIEIAKWKIAWSLRNFPGFIGKIATNYVWENSDWEQPIYYD